MTCCVLTVDHGRSGVESLGTEGDRDLFTWGDAVAPRHARFGATNTRHHFHFVVVANSFLRALTLIIVDERVGSNVYFFSMAPLTVNSHKSTSRGSQILAALTCLAGGLTYVTLSNAWRFHSHLQLQQQQSFSSAAQWGQDVPSLNAIAADHPSHRYLEQGPRPLPGLLDDTTKFNTEVLWPFSKAPTAVRL